MNFLSGVISKGKALIPSLIQSDASNICKNLMQEVNKEEVLKVQESNPYFNSKDLKDFPLIALLILSSQQIEYTYPETVQGYLDKADKLKNQICAAAIHNIDVRYS